MKGRKRSSFFSVTSPGVKYKDLESFFWRVYGIVLGEREGSCLNGKSPGSSEKRNPAGGVTGPGGIEWHRKD